MGITQRTIQEARDGAEHHLPIQDHHKTAQSLALPKSDHKKNKTNLRGLFGISAVVKQD